MRLRSQAGRSATRVAAEQDRPAPAAPDRVGSRLIDSGELAPDELERVAEYQARTGATFADAAVDLGLIAPEAVSRALAEHAQAGLVNPQESGISRAVVAAYDPLDPLALKLRALRSTLFGPDDMRGPGERVLVLAGVGTEDTAGVAANLAVLVAQLALRGLLVDANFAAPAQHALFGVDDSGGGVTSLLAGGGAQEAAVAPTPVPNLDLLPAGPEIGSLSENAERVSLVAQIRAMRHGHRFAIVDAGDQAPEMVAALARGADGVLIVAERRRTPIQSVRTLLRRLESNEIPILGVVLAR